MGDMTARDASAALAKFRAGAEEWSREQAQDPTNARGLELLAQRQRDDEALDLAHEIAYETSRSDIECACPLVGDNLHAPPHYWDTAAEIPADDRVYIDRAVRYLHLAGLLDCSADNPAHVHIRDHGDTP